MTLSKMFIPGSRRPIVVDRNGVLVPSNINSCDATPVIITSPRCPQSPPTSAWRRKPRYTYRSPSSTDSTGPRIEGVRAPAKPRAHPPPLSPYPRSPQHPQLRPAFSATHQPAPSLYHPLGRLASSLPTVNLDTLGLRYTAADANEHQLATAASEEPTSQRARKPTAKQREATGTATPSNHINTATANGTEHADSGAPTPAEPDRVSPRKRRGGGGSAKRKRRDPEDGDTAYPSKRTRTRGGAGAVEASPAPSAVPLEGEDEDELPRRSTRARTAAASRAQVLARRGRAGSAESEASESSVSMSVAAGRAKRGKSGAGAAAAEEEQGADKVPGQEEEESKEKKEAKVEEEEIGEEKEKEDAADVVMKEDVPTTEELAGEGDGETIGDPGPPAEAESAITEPAVVEQTPATAESEDVQMTSIPDPGASATSGSVRPTAVPTDTPPVDMVEAQPTESEALKTPTAVPLDAAASSPAVEAAPAATGEAADGTVQEPPESSRSALKTNGAVASSSSGEQKEEGELTDNDGSDYEQVTASSGLPRRRWAAQARRTPYGYHKNYRSQHRYNDRDR